MSKPKRAKDLSPDQWIDNLHRRTVTISMLCDEYKRSREALDFGIEYGGPALTKEELRQLLDLGIDLVATARTFAKRMRKQTNHLCQHRVPGSIGNATPGASSALALYDVLYPLVVESKAAFKSALSMEASYEDAVDTATEHFTRGLGALVLEPFIVSPASTRSPAQLAKNLLSVGSSKVSPRRTASAESIDKRSAVWAGRSPRAVAGARVCNEGPPSN